METNAFSVLSIQAEGGPRANQQHFDSKEDRLAHERSSHQANRTGPSVEDANTTVVEDRDRNTRKSA
jgi:hypothetical protein